MCLVDDVPGAGCGDVCGFVDDCDGRILYYLKLLQLDGLLQACKDAQQNYFFDESAGMALRITLVALTHFTEFLAVL